MYPRRPESPPPRAPSPEVGFAPLPVRSRNQSAASSSSTAAAARARTRLSPPRALRSVRSTDAFRPTKKPLLALNAQPRKMRSHGTLHEAAEPPSLPSSPRSTASSSTSSSSSMSSRRSHRSLSHAVPYRSPPASPNVAAAPPPVPPIPAFALDERTPLKQTQMRAPLLEPENIAHMLGRPIVSRKTSFRDMRQGLTCASFFSLRNATRHTPTTTTV
ncbi:hypothetical protein BD626DRAFT_534033 [Schizophyllum amplum]|uniref:Uncharacterized protein n=1 Tax=Schizophyllum amplum TaxID=97359 RepID=A0A550CSA4_9AGAR|nr:hypothetical protein BD626DRAFT_534033 [Auriculariopsis ampla]